MAARIIAFPINAAQRTARERDQLLGYFEEYRGKFPEHSLERAWSTARLAVAIDQKMEAVATPAFPDDPSKPGPVRQPSKRTPHLRVLPSAPKNEPHHPFRRRDPDVDLATDNLVNQMRALGSGELEPRNESEVRLQQLAMKLNRRLAQLREERLARSEPDGCTRPSVERTAARRSFPVKHVIVTDAG